MSYWASIDGYQIAGLELLVPWFGIWVAEITVADEIPVNLHPAVTVGDATLVGTVVRSANYGGTRTLRLIGGYAGWRRAVAARCYYHPGGVPRSMVLSDVAIECGESLDVSGSTGSLGIHYVRQAGQAERVLSAVNGSCWYTDFSGITRLLPRTTNQITSEFQVIKHQGKTGYSEIAAESVADWLPGNTWISPTVTTPQVISLVRHVVQNDGTYRSFVASV